MRYRILDLFCKQGGMAAGYVAAGFDIVGVDIVDQPRYPYEFLQADAIDVLKDKKFVRGFDAIHTSPPCQGASAITPSKYRAGHPDLIPVVRPYLLKYGKPFVIENVPGASLAPSAVQLCGSSFGLRVRRHRLFEVNFPLVAPPCDHKWQDSDALYRQSEYRKGKAKRWTGVVGVYGRGCGLGDRENEIWADVMEINWMTMSGMAEAMPPVYGGYIGRRMIRHLKDQAREPVEGS